MKRGAPPIGVRPPNASPTEAPTRVGGARSFQGGLTAAFAVVVVAFTAATAYSERRGRGIDTAAIAIATDAAPAIQDLATARSELRRPQVVEDGYADALRAGQAASPGPLVQARLGMDRAFAQYRQLPPHPVEEALRIDAQMRIATLEVALAELVAAGNRGDLQALVAADARFRAAVEPAAAALNRSIGFNARDARALAMQIEQIRARSRRLVYGLDVLCVLATGVAAALLARGLRANRRLVEEYQSFLERRSDELEAFAGRVAHDIKSPLTSLQLSLDRAARLRVDERTGAEIQRGQRTLGRVVQLVDGLLGFARAGARPEAGARVTVTDVLGDVAAAERPEAEQARCELVVEPRTAGQVACSAGVLGSLLVNLIGNALKYMGSSPRRRVTVRALDRGARVRFEVEDTGPGIPASQRGAIFDPYVRGSDSSPTPGLGLGLATVRRLAEGHGGAAGVESAATGGSLFWFELPRASPA
jgi:signal transduction histidine kinase